MIGNGLNFPEWMCDLCNIQRRIEGKECLILPANDNRDFPGNEN
jgi:hypothetical protein